MTEVIDVDGRSVRIGNPDKVLFPADGITKADLANYYHRVAGVMLAHVEGRPLTMQRFPDGIDADGFFHKDTPDHFPDWIRTRTVPKEGGEIDHVVADDAATLVFLADQACITPHVWLSRADRLDHPDRMVFDLDPPEGSGPDPIRAAARRVRHLLEGIGLACFVMTTGSSGYHVVAPLDRSSPFDDVRDLAHRCALVLADRFEDDLTVSQRKDRRGDRVYLDYLRNAYGQTTVAPYAVRALTGAPVATPIEWRELGSTEPRSYTMSNLLRRLGQRSDPWSAISEHAGSASDAARRLDDAS